MRGDLVINVFLLLLAGYFYKLTYSFKQISKYDVMGPGFWPRIVLVFLMGLIIFAIVIEIRKMIKKVSQEEDKNQKISYKKFIFALVVSFGYFFIMRYVGFVIATLVFQGMFLFVQGVRQVKILILTPSVLTLLLFILFIKLMYLPLPKGIGIFRSFSLLLY
ncbi:MAG: hypothetical protein VR72_02195 [Clostridiaceae bacterium BRH_c20a]|nr:MAG: hypothetical protein VR72_02195 [Clostridiaceae bacterium BRH_c20a]